MPVTNQINQTDANQAKLTKKKYVKLVIAGLIKVILDVWHISNLVFLQNDLSYLAALICPAVIVIETAYVCVVRKGHAIKWYVIT